VLSVRDIWKSFGGIKALQGVSFEIGQGQICGLIGPNGAGKTTLFNCLSRIYEPDRGAIAFEERNLLGCAPHRVVSAGIARTFQNVSLFPTMTVLENVLVGAHSTIQSNPLLTMVRWPSVSRGERQARDRAVELIDYFSLGSVSERPAGLLPFATRKRVELARALMSSPRLLLLDEPAGGLNHEEVGQLGELIRTIRADLGLTILLVEHHMQLVMGISDKVCVMDFGRMIAEGAPNDVQSNADVIRAYLGETREEHVV
jgi:branched-chain amino acid transport system ATP-binding protein